MPKPHGKYSYIGLSSVYHISHIYGSFMVIGTVLVELVAYPTHNCTWYGLGLSQPVFLWLYTAIIQITKQSRLFQYIVLYNVKYILIPDPPEILNLPPTSGIKWVFQHALFWCFSILIKPADHL